MMETRLYIALVIAVISVCSAMALASNLGY